MFQQARSRSIFAHGERINFNTRPLSHRSTFHHNAAMRAALLLICSNIFMTFAWYGHLKWFPRHGEGSSYFPFKIIMISWGIAFFEYCFQVPGNRIGEQLEGMTLGQLKIMQEVITLSVFTIFAITVKASTSFSRGGTVRLAY